ncbi:MAG: hypothetical protein ABI039_04065, partial [Vicinamibacterales bacterium]
MSVAILRLALRSAAVLIGIMALIDPVSSSRRPSSRDVVAIHLAGTDVRATVALLSSGLPGWQVMSREAAGPRIPCGPDERCVVFADGSQDAGIPLDVKHPISLVVVSPGGGPNVSLQSVVAGAGHIAAAATARVELRREGAVARTQIEVRDGAAVVGTAVHEWTSELATVDVPWWPIAAGSRTLRIEAVPLEDEWTAIDNAIDVGVTVATARAAVVVYDARPSWNSTFVRRA